MTGDPLGKAPTNLEVSVVDASAQPVACINVQVPVEFVDQIGNGIRAVA